MDLTAISITSSRGGPNELSNTQNARPAIHPVEGVRVRSVSTHALHGLSCREAESAPSHERRAAHPCCGPAASAVRCSR
jgi:hypothetical protein